MKKQWQVKHISDEDGKRAAELAWKRRREMAARGRYGPEPHRTPHVLAELTGAPLKVCYRKIEQLCDRGLMNYGVSIDGSWWEENPS